MTDKNVSFIACVLLFELMFNVTVNNFSVRSTRSYHGLGINKGVIASYSMLQHGTPAGFEPRTSRFGVRISTARPTESQLLFHIIVNLRWSGKECFFFSIKNITRYGRIGYNLNAMRQSACLVFNPIMVDNYAAFFNCTLVGRASDSMMAPT